MALLLNIQTNLLRVCLSALLGLTGCVVSFAQSAAIAEPDSNLAETGTPFRLHLYVPGAAGTPAQPDFSVWDSIMPPANILSQTDWKSSGGRWVKDLTLITFNEDTLVLAPLPIPLTTGQRVLTNLVRVPVILTPSGTDINDMRGAKDIHREPVVWQDFLPWILAGAGLLLLVLLFWWLMVRRSRKEAVRRSVQLPPHELALKKLEALSARRLWQDGQVKAYYAELSFIVREYLQQRYQLSILESTTAETIHKIGGLSEFPSSMLSGIRNFLEQADLAKFANADPSMTYHEAAFAFARRLIEDTIPAPEPNDPSTAAPSQP